ncbi:MAG: glycosyltransferase [Pedococcus sp.]
MRGSAGPSTHPARAVSQALDAVRSAPTILEALRLVTGVAAAAADDHCGSCRDELRSVATDRSDAVAALAAVHALAALPVADTATLVRLLGSGDAFRVEHAAWALRRSAPVAPGAPHLVALVATGGVTGMLAQRTLEHWAPQAPDLVLTALSAALEPGGPALPARDDATRTRLVETVGLVPGAAATALLLGIVDDDTEAPTVVAAATAALGDRSIPRPGRGAACHGQVTAMSTHRGACPADGPGSAGITVAQLFLHADIDGELSSAGKGDTGGIATLLVHLGNALLESDRGIDRVVTMSRGGPDLHPLPGDLALRGHHYVQIPLWGPPVAMADAWMHRIAVRRGVRQILRAAGRVDAIHLRMADVGSFAAAQAARELEIPVVFTVAPDPQAMLAAREASGALTRESFAQADALEHLTFRDHLVRVLSRDADQLVLFPRPALRRDSRDLLGLDLDVEANRATVVAEGIDFRAVDRAGAAQRRGAVPAGDPAEQALAELDTLLGGLPAQRRVLPLVITVGRLNRVKGMATLVETWHGDADLRARCNLLVVGGDLDHPSADEVAELARVDAVVPRAAAARDGLLLPGHRPHATVATWLAATLRGRPGLAAPSGVYVSASLKEEFGLAILEAMAASLVVVAPDGGGPATYVEPGVSGILAETASPAALAQAIGQALDMAASPQTAMRQRRALSTLRDRFSITTMASALAGIYARASGLDAAVAHSVRQAPPAGTAS